MSNWFDIGLQEEFSDGAVMAVQAYGQPLAIFRMGEDLFALRDKCSHGNARLSDGYIEDGCVECPLHQGLFDIRTGAPRCAPVTEPVRSFPVRVVAGRVQVKVEEQVTQEPAARRVSARIDSIEKLGFDVIVMRLQQDDGAPLQYQAGQYLDILLDGGVRRSYSMASPCSSAQLELHIRHLPGGIFTDQVFGDLRPGQHLTLEGPAGDFYLRQSAAPVVLLASGTGFAPLKALLEQAIAQGNQRPMQLYWGGRRPADLYMDALCRQWAGELSWFDYFPVLSAATTEDTWTGRTGNVHQAVLQDHTDLSQHAVYACGAPAMVAAARSDFTVQRALAHDHFFADAFLSQADL
jgi:NAD(P)H-flavin reductase/nitrite reductase/ring-hydroxylating ferredoxin subunit